MLEPRFLFVAIVLSAYALAAGCEQETAPSPHPVTAAETPALTIALPTLISTSMLELTATPTAVPPGRTIVVTSTADSGPGTLRQALLDAQPGDAVTFDPTAFPPENLVTIQLAGGLPALTRGYLTVDASNAGVILDGSLIPGGPTSGLAINSDGNTIRGLQIVGFSDDGIMVENGSQNIVGGDRGTGNGPLGQGNLISGNGSRGIVVSGGGHNTIEGNFIGTDLTGSTAWGNHLDGIHLRESGSNRMADNLVSGNRGLGIDLYLPLSSYNTIEGNRIGTDISGLNPLGNGADGIAIHDGTSHNVIGPDNIIAFNSATGVAVAHVQTYCITITRNNLHDNGGGELYLGDGSNGSLTPPLLYYYDLSAGALAGTACAGCIVEVFSEGDHAGMVYEGQVVADTAGCFSVNRGAPFTNPHVICTSTDADGNTSNFSMPAVGISTALQEGSPFPVAPLQTSPPDALPQHHIGVELACWEWIRGQYNVEPYQSLMSSIQDLGVQWVRLSNWSPSPLIWQEVLVAPGEYDIPQDVDDFVTELAESSVHLVLSLSAGAGLDGPEYGWWGGVGWGMLGEREPEWWFRTQDERDRYAEFVRFMVEHFKGRVEYYEIWNEADSGENAGDPRGGVALGDYVLLVTQVAPMIHDIDPDARVVVGAVGRFYGEDRRWLLTMLESGVAPLVDTISWHPFYGESPILYSGAYPTEPEPFYWRDYSASVLGFRREAAARGFEGEYVAEEMIWRSPSEYNPAEPLTYTEVVAAKYAARANVLHLALGFTMVGNQLPNSGLPRYYVIRNLSTVTAGAEPAELPVAIQSEAPDVVTYSFTLPDGDYLVAVWADGGAVDDDPGVETILTVQGLSAQEVTGIDVLHGFEQQMVTQDEDGSLVIHDLLVKNYPIFLRFSGVNASP